MVEELTLEERVTNVERGGRQRAILQAAQPAQMPAWLPSLIAVVVTVFMMLGLQNTVQDLEARVRTLEGVEHRIDMVRQAVVRLEKVQRNLETAQRDILDAIDRALRVGREQEK